MNNAHITRILIVLQRSVKAYAEGHEEVSWYWLLEWSLIGGKL